MELVYTMCKVGFKYILQDLPVGAIIFRPEGVIFYSHIIDTNAFVSWHPVLRSFIIILSYPFITAILLVLFRSL